MLLTNILKNVYFETNSSVLQDSKNMKLPELANSYKYVGLYIVDFGGHTGLGFTAREVAELLESENFKNIKIYKIYNAHPDGKMELKGLRREIFQLEMGMFFYSNRLDAANRDFKQLIALTENELPPSKAKVHLARYNDGRFVTALIYPAEFDDEFSRWLLKADYKTAGPVQGGIEALQSYYDQAPGILQRRQLFGESAHQSRTGDELLAATKTAVQR